MAKVKIKRGWVITTAYDSAGKPIPGDFSVGRFRTKVGHNGSASWVGGIMPPSLAKEAAAELPHAFRLLDEDGLLLYSGRSSALTADPLEWGSDDGGCRQLQYLRHDGSYTDYGQESTEGGH